jgi:hypothetical protein
MRAVQWVGGRSVAGRIASHVHCVDCPLTCMQQLNGKSN